MKLQVRPSEFHQLLRKVAIEFLGCAGDCQWGRKRVVFGVGRLLRNDGRSERIALNEGDGQQQPAFSQQGHKFCEHVVFLRCECVAGFKSRWGWVSFGLYAGRVDIR